MESLMPSSCRLETVSELRFGLGSSSLPEGGSRCHILSFIASPRANFSTVVSVSAKALMRLCKKPVTWWGFEKEVGRGRG